MALKCEWSKRERLTSQAKLQKLILEPQRNTDSGRRSHQVVPADKWVAVPLLHTHFDYQFWFLSIIVRMILRRNLLNSTITLQVASWTKKQGCLFGRE